MLPSDHVRLLQSETPESGSTDARFWERVRARLRVTARATLLGLGASRPFCLVSCVFVAAEGSGRYVDVACTATDYCVGAIAADVPPPGFAVRKLIDLAA